MGCVLTTNSGHISPPPPPSSSSSSGTQSISNLILTPDLTSYQSACQSDPDLQSFDSTLQDRTTRVINSLAAGVEVRSLSLDSLREVTGSLLDMNQEVVKVILDCKKDIWKNDELFSLVEDFFDLSLQTLDFVISLESCLKTARFSSSFLQIAINQFDGNHDYVETLEQFRRFEALEAPFSEEFFENFQSVYKQQLSMLKKLQKQKGKVARKLKSARSWRKLTNVIFVITFSTVLICSAAAVPLGSMGKWVNSLWKKYETELKGQRELISSMQIGNSIVIKDLVNIKALVDKLGVEMEGLLQNAEFAINEEDEDAVAMAVDEMRKSVNDFGKTIDDLSDHSFNIRGDISRARKTIDDLSDHSFNIRGDISRARKMIVQRLSKHPSDSY